MGHLNSSKEILPSFVDINFYESMYESYSVIFIRWLNIVRSVGETHAVVITFFAFAPVSLPLNRYEKVEVDMSKMSKIGAV
jgi:hypothetical protein